MVQKKQPGTANPGLTVLILILAISAAIAIPALGAAGGKGGGAHGGGGKPGGSTTGGGTIGWKMVDPTDTVPNYTDKVTFDVSTTATDMPYVHLQCSQGSTRVLDDRTGFFPTALGDKAINLGPTPAWTGGDASCTAYLEKYTSKGWQQLASTSFTAIG